VFPHSWLQRASERLAPYILRTPLTYDAARKVYLKWENHQVTGSFKARGALNKVLSLENWERSRGIVAASAGNHGQGVALAGKLVGASVSVFVAETAVPTKVAAMRSLGAQIHTVPGGYGEAEQAGINYAKSNNLTWVSPYNDAQVIAGQATVAMEIIQEAPQLQDAVWVVPVGGGGLISGIGAALSTLNHPPPLYGVQSTASPFLCEIFHRGSQAGIIELPSLADGLAGPLEEGSVTIPLVKQWVEDILLVDESDIANAILFAWKAYGEKLEGSAAVPLAALLSGKITQTPAVLILTGGNILPELHQRIINGHYPR